MPESPAPREEARKGEVIEEGTKVSLKLVIGAVMGAVTATGLYFGVQAQIAEANTRIDSLEAKVEHIEELECQVARKDGILDTSCAEVLRRSRVVVP